MTNAHTAPKTYGLHFPEGTPKRLDSIAVGTRVRVWKQDRLAENKTAFGPFTVERVTRAWYDTIFHCENLAVFAVDNGGGLSSQGIGDGQWYTFAIEVFADEQLVEAVAGCTTAAEAIAAVGECVGVVAPPAFVAAVEFARSKAARPAGSAGSSCTYATKHIGV